MSDTQFDYESALVKGKKASDGLKKLRDSFENVCRLTELFRNKVTYYSAWFKENLCVSPTAFFIQVQDATKELVKQRGIEMKRSVDVKFDVVKEMLYALETERGHPGWDLNSVEQYKLLVLCQMYSLLSALSCSGISLEGLTLPDIFTQQFERARGLFHYFRLKYGLVCARMVERVILGSITITSNSSLGSTWCLPIRHYPVDYLVDISVELLL